MTPTHLQYLDYPKGETPYVRETKERVERGEPDPREARPRRRVHRTPAEIARAEARNRGGQAAIDARTEKRARGFLAGGPAPFGYVWVGESGKRVLVRHEPEATILNEIFQRAARGDLVTAIVAWLEERYKTKPNGLPMLWSRQRVGNLIHARTYLGEINLGGEYRRAEHEPLVSRRLFERACEQLASRAK